MEHITKQFDSMKDRVLQKIGAEGISMRSKKYFALKAVAIIALAFFALALSAFVFNFIFFNLRINEHGYLLSFGPRGFWLFAKVFPWGMLALDIALIILLEWLLRKFRFAYRVPALYLLAGLLLVAAIVGFSVDRGTPFNDRILDRIGEDRLPSAIRGLYEGTRRIPEPGHGVCDCIVEKVEGALVTAHDARDLDRKIGIIVPLEDPLLAGLKPGDRIFAGGEFQEDGMLHAFGLRGLLQKPARVGY